jgi:hypothetical protein
MWHAARVGLTSPSEDRTCPLAACDDDEPLPYQGVDLPAQEALSRF